MGPDKFTEAVEKIIETDSRYHRIAYVFVNEGLSCAVKKLSENPKRKDRAEAGHVTARELLEGVTEHAIEQFGPLAATILRQWGINEADDVGQIVFSLIGAGVFGKAQSDNQNDFKDESWDFQEHLQAPFLPLEETRQMHQKALADAAKGAEDHIWNDLILGETKPSDVFFEAMKRTFGSEKNFEATEKRRAFEAAKTMSKETQQLAREIEELERLLSEDDIEGDDDVVDVDADTATPKPSKKTSKKSAPESAKKSAKKPAAPSAKPTAPARAKKATKKPKTPKKSGD